MSEYGLSFLQNFIEVINQTNSNLDKQKVIKQFYTENKELFSKLMLYVYDYHKKYYVTSANLLKREDLINESNMDDLTIFDILDSLSNRCVSGYDAIALINGFIQQNIQYKDLILKIIDKDLQCRIDVKTLNKVIPNLIPSFNVSLGEKVDWDRFDWQNTDWYISRKIDGCLHYDTSVLLSDGSYKSIGEIVDNKLDVKVVSYNELTNTFEDKPILNYMKNGVDIKDENIEWFEIELENGTRIKLTGNHKVYLPELRCYRRVDELNGDENILYTI